MTAVFFWDDNTIRRGNNAENRRCSVCIDIIHNAIRRDNIRRPPKYLGGIPAKLWIPTIWPRQRFAIDNCIAFNVLLIDCFDRSREIDLFNIGIIKYIRIDSDDTYYSPMGGYCYFRIAAVISLDYGAAYVRAIGYKINLPFQLEEF